MSDIPSFPDKFPDDSDYEQDRGVDHFLNDLDKLINRYSMEYDLSFAEILGCLRIQEQFVLDTMTGLAMQAHLDELEELEEESDEDYNNGDIDLTEDDINE